MLELSKSKMFFLSKKNWVQKNFGLKDLGSTNDTWTHVTVTIGMVPGTSLVQFGQIGCVPSEIFLKWTNVTRTNVARTNVAWTVGICSRGSQEPNFKVW